MQQEQFSTLSGAPGIAPDLRQFEPACEPAFEFFEDDAPQCCGTGCTVCVLDYPELFSGDQPSDTLALLEAVEQAHAEANKMIADNDLQ